ncbi:MAG TPA: hypothetical protein VGL40_13325 [Bacillota bacterium]|jgi:hypothetical protein
MKRLAFLVALLLVWTTLGGCSPRPPVPKDADRVLMVTRLGFLLSTDGLAQDFLHTLRQEMTHKVEGQELLPTDSIRLIISKGFSGPGQALLYDEPRGLVFCSEGIYRLSQELPTWQLARDDSMSVRTGTYAFSGPVMEWLEAEGKDRDMAAVVGCGGLIGGEKILLVTAGAEPSGGKVVDLVNADYREGAWRLMFALNESQGETAAQGDAPPFSGFVAVFPGSAKIEVYVLREGLWGQRPKGGPVKEERIPVPKSNPPSSEPADVCRTLFSDYLMGYKSAAADISFRLADYRIDSVEFWPEKSAAGQLTYLVRFSVLPAGEWSVWGAGDGRLDPDGWIVGKSFFVHIADEGAGYHIELLDNGSI